MTKRDLRTGMVVTCKNNNRYVCIKDYPDCEEGVFINIDPHGGFLKMSEFNDDLTNGGFWEDSNYDVVKVESSHIVVDFRKCFIGQSTNYKTIWTREPKTFKVVCVNNAHNCNYTVGKIYRIDNATLIDDDGTSLFEGRINSFDDLKEISTAEWLKVVEE